MSSSSTISHRDRRDKSQETMNGSAPRPSTPSQAGQQRPPYLPTPLESILLAIYPATLLLGSLFSLIDPSARVAPYSATLQSHPPEVAPSYFAQKKNIFNVWFVKKGWFWTTLAYFIFLFTHPSTGPSRHPVLTPRRVRGFLRWTAVTLWWMVLTQWFFGPPLIDRSFRFTGGQCELVRDPEAREDMSAPREILSATACKLAGGSWKGGYDISGHVFMLVLGSAFLWLEILPVVLRSAGLREDRIIKTPAGEVRESGREVEVESIGTAPHAHGDPSTGVKAAVVVVALSWWMLLMTAAYFHTWFEKFTGLVVAFFGIFSVYFLPRAVPAVRNVIGMPGV
ncbi:hypothetical protein L228DRAFT_282237 [Xylona heveae TC161]|uniref:Acyl-coenzyme A diphosphatase SCS3 n=1 Tax=Xylona heveae (strain CBS 132557 / TC161) TaxID=1328760 RepID=A0A165HHB6_XYLHT|nr:hypothetical protein L228DRAFT_282237 [Xylona heveae TC161]KZF23516.1 hypothetical protein L228DRAFT_282237 [Xylona heveae TC161]